MHNFHLIFRAKQFLWMGLFLFALTLMIKESKANDFTVSLSSATTEENAYHNPMVTAAYTRRTEQEGVIDWLLNTAANNISSVIKEDRLNKQNGTNHAKLQEMLTSELNSDLLTALYQLLKVNTMSSRYMSEQSNNHLDIRINEFGLRKNDDSTDGEIKFALYLKTTFKITDPQNKELIKKTYTTYSTATASLMEYLNSPEVSQTITKDAQTRLANQIAVELYLLAARTNSL